MGPGKLGPVLVRYTMYPYVFQVNDDMGDLVYQVLYHPDQLQVEELQEIFTRAITETYEANQSWLTSRATVPKINKIFQTLCTIYGFKMYKVPVVNVSHTILSQMRLWCGCGLELIDYVQVSDCGTGSWPTDVCMASTDDMYKPTYTPEGQPALEL